MLSIIAVLAVGFSIFEAIQINDLKQELKRQSSSTVESQDSSNNTASKNYRIERYESDKYYVITGDYSGEYGLCASGEKDLSS